jgi:hypothetical protein
MIKKCSCCPQPADFSVVSIVSSVGVSKRLQKCSPAVLFCASCLQKRLKREHRGSDKLREAVNSAYTALNQGLRARSL